MNNLTWRGMHSKDIKILEASGESNKQDLEAT